MAKTTTRSTRSGEMNVYTALLVIAALVLGAGVTVISLANMKQVESTSESGSPVGLVR
jgi:hypothetical protein